MSDRARVKLETSYTVLADRVSDKAAELQAAEAALAATVAALVDGEGERGEVLRRRGDLALEADALRDELGELQRRRDVADLARYEWAEADAKRQLEEAATKAREARYALDDALNAERRGQRAGRDGDADRARTELAVTVTRTKAESGIAGRHAERAKLAHEAARQATAEARTRLGIAGA